METDAMREYAKLQIQQILVNIRFGGQQHQQQQQRQQQYQSRMHHSNTGFLQSLLSQENGEQYSEQFN